MKIAYFDCFSGAAGDMILGALIDAGLALADLEKELAGLPVSGYSLEARKVMRSGISATKFDVHLHEQHSHGGGGGHSHHGRHLPEILTFIEESGLPDPAKAAASKTFRRLADAEGDVHGKPPEEIHFHEVGAVDSIVDVVGAAAALSLMGIERVYCSPFRVGTGTTRCAHGEIPVPAPATVRLLQGFPIIQTAVEGELTTPSGAAILTTVAADFGPMPACRITSTGYGAGSRDIEGRANVLRVIIGDTAADDLESDVVEVIEANVDDMSPEFFGGIFERLLAAGALDVSVAPLQMKKSRPGFLISAIVPSARSAAVQEVFFRETTTFGLRIFEARRAKLARETRQVQTPLGTVRIKIGVLGGRIIRAKPEHDDCARIASERGLPFREVYAAALKVAEEEKRKAEG